MTNRSKSYLFADYVRTQVNNVVTQKQTKQQHVSNYTSQKYTKICTPTMGKNYTKLQNFQPCKNKTKQIYSKYSVKTYVSGK